MSIKTIAGDLQVDIDAGDWVSIAPNVMDPDPTWGLSFEVSDTPGGVDWIYVKALVPNTEEYADTGLSLSNIIENFRKVPFEE